MVFLVEMLGCTSLSEELDRALEIFPMYLQSQCLGMPSLVLRGLLRLSERPDTARKTLVLLPYVMEQLQGADSDASAIALSLLSNLLRLLEGKTLSLTALALAEKLQPLFSDESSTVRELSIRLFRNTMGVVVDAKKKKMKEVVWGSLLPLLFHLHDEDKNVAKLARNRSRAKEYLRQSQSYLRSPQEPLRREAVRFIGLIGRQVDGHEELQYIREVLQDAGRDTSLLVSSLATQALLILSLRKAESRFNVQRLSFRLLRAWTRWHSAPSEDSAQAERKQQPQP
ncbi:maestro heat-like repeat-containing protein family member 6 [Phalacrocorax aristotelis]|uniref:maestro heat-like repeat-containing protein family member 6 n=1 Tax=Phalacrocorax aristotelis TaxID=126867 RepID=UPI003F4C983C